VKLARDFIAACVVLLSFGCNAPIEFEAPRAAKPDSGAGGAPQKAPGWCSNDADCRLDSLHCDTVSHTCVACVGDGDCTAPLKRCDFALHMCVECGNPGDCETGQTCEATGHCIGTCSAGTPCPAETPTCDSRGFCIGCARNTDCTSVETPLCNVATGRCVQCLRPEDCTTLLPRCDPYKNVCVGCLSAADCASNHEHHLCNPTTGACYDD
jgi:hypothetical protein